MKYLTSYRLREGITVGFVIAGCFGVMTELLPEGAIYTSTWWIGYLALSFVLLAVVRSMRTCAIREHQMRQARYRSLNPERSNTKLFEGRMKRIKHLADKATSQVTHRNHPCFMEATLTISYEDALMIWDVADKALHETPVQEYEYS